MSHEITPTQPPAHSILLEAGRVPSVSPSPLSQCPQEEDTKSKSFLENASGLLQAASDDSSPGQQGTQMTLRGLSSGIRPRCEGVAMASEARERSVWPFCLPMPKKVGGGELPGCHGVQVLNGWSSERPWRGFYSGRSPSARPLRQRPRRRHKWSSSSSSAQGPAGRSPSPCSCGLQGHRVSGGIARQWVSNRATACNPEGAQCSRPARDFGKSR